MEARLWIGSVGITEIVARSHAIAVYSRSVPAAAGAGSEDSLNGQQDALGQVDSGDEQAVCDGEDTTEWVGKGCFEKWAGCLAGGLGR